MARRIAILLCLLCAASTVVVGAIEPCTDAWIAHDAVDRRVLVQIYYGRVLVDHIRSLDSWFSLNRPLTNFSQHDPGAPRNTLFGARWDHWLSPEGDHFRIEVPNYLPFLIFMIYPAVRLSLIARRGIRRRTGRYAPCGYDLTGNVTGVCPECGVPT